jgi:hypothetical protein
MFNVTRDFSIFTRSILVLTLIQKAAVMVNLNQLSYVLYIPIPNDSKYFVDILEDLVYYITTTGI